MAITTKDHTGNGTVTDYSFPFPYIKQSDIKVTLDNVEKEEGTTKDYTFANATTVRFNSPPAADVAIKIYRATDDSNLVATFYPGSAIRSSDLNDNYTQNLYSTQENTNDAAEALSNSRALESGVYVTAIDKSITALSTANTAKDTADLADAAATSAVNTAGQANNTSTQANNTASNAVNIANAALPKAGGTMTGAIAMGTNKITGAGDPTSAQDVATKTYVDTVDATKLAKAGDTMSGALAMGTNKITGVGDPTDNQDVVTKAYLVANNYTKAEADSAFFNVSTGETIKEGDTFPDNDTTIATTAAINDRIVDIIDEVGGFIPLVNEAAIPADHPEKANDTTADRVGTIISIGTLSATYTPSGGTCTIPSGTLTNHSVNATITDCGSTTLSTGFGVLVETTAQTDAQYAAGPTFKFHRLVPKATEVTTVASKATEITTVAGKTTEITTCHNKATEITTCHNKATEITTCHDKAAEIENVSNNITDVNNFADLYQIATSAPTTDGGGNSLADGDLWFDSSSNKAMKVYNGTAFAAVTPVQSVLDDIAIVSGNLTRQEDLGSIADAISSGTGTGSLDTCATNITNINTFANVYRIASSAPSSSLDEGDLWYDSTNNVLKIYNGSAWVVTASAGLGSLLEDTSPELGGNLDCNDKNLTAVATVSGDNLQIDFGTL